MSKIYLAGKHSRDVIIGDLLEKFSRKVEVYPPGTCPLTVQLSLLHASMNQTCGKCVPCRDGLPQLAKLLEKILNGVGSMEMLDKMKEIAIMIRDSADCAIGYQSAIEVLEGLEMFASEYESHIRAHECPQNVGQKVPCVTLCPAHVDIPGYIAHVHEGNYADAINLIRRDNPLPTACAMICEHPCEERCRRNLIDDSINIRGIKKYAVDQIAADQVAVPKANVSTGKKVAVIGGGPAGMTAAYFLSLMGHKVTVYEAKEHLGGMLMYGIPNYRFPKDRMDEDMNAILSTGNIEVKYNTNVGVDISVEEVRNSHDAMFVAIGAQKGKKLRLENIDANNVLSAVEMLDEIGHGHRPDYTGKTVAVIGGGNVAIDAARVSSRCTDAKISMFCLETREKMPASNEEIEEALEEGIELNCGWGPKEILEEDGHVRGVVFKKCTRVFDAHGRFSPEYDENDTVTVPCRHVIFSVGQAIDWGHMLDNLHVELRPNGGALANKLTYQTSEPDIFVGGDVYTGPKFAIDAIAAGREGAVSLHRYVHENCTLTIGRNRRDFIELDKENIKVETYDSSSRQIPPKADVKEQAKTFRDLSQSLSEEQVKKETSRCLSCGASVVDPNKCIGCGICTTKCMFDAIHLHRELPGASVMRTSEEKLKYILPNMVKQSIKVKFKKKK